MPKVKTLVIGGNGTNCERETAFACKRAYADVVDIVPIWDLIAGEKRIGDYQLLCLPGGFLDGDDLGSAKACANRYHYAQIADTKRRLWDELVDFVRAGKLVIGICNGFQLLVKLGLLPWLDESEPKQVATITCNDSGRFETRWVELLCDPESPCVFTRGLNMLPVPIRHGEGKFVVSHTKVMTDLENKHLIPVRYADPKTGRVTEEYPANPNGSAGGVAGICDPTGRIFGLMPHPECFQLNIDHPRWRRMPHLPEEGLGIIVFRNAVNYLKS